MRAAPLTMVEGDAIGCSMNQSVDHRKDDEDQGIGSEGESSTSTLTGQVNRINGIKTRYWGCSFLGARSTPKLAEFWKGFLMFLTFSLVFEE